MPLYHWRIFKKQDRMHNGVTVPMSEHALFNESGLSLGRVEKTTYGEWMAFAGRPGVFIGNFPTVEEAKSAVEKTIKE